MNLIESKWVPVLMPDNTIQKLSPLEIPGSEALRVQHPRADYSALITEILVSLNQTLTAPATASGRLNYRRKPMSVDLTAMRAAAPSFELLGNEARFMQSPEPTGKLLDVRALAFEAPGENTLTKNTDVFVTREELGTLCPHCAPVALFLNQAHARLVGQGYYATSRGGSVLTVLVKGQNLWETIALNVLGADEFNAKFAVEGGPAGVYPWTTGQKTFTQAKLKPEQLGAYAGLWWCPSALRLVEQANAAKETCSFCGEIHDVVIKQVHRGATKSRAPEVKHPLTSYNFYAAKGKNEEKTLPVMVPRQSQRIEDLLALSIGSSSPGRTSLGAVPAINLIADGAQREKVAIWSFGCQMDKSTLIAWFDEVTPGFIAADLDAATALRLEASKLVESVQIVRSFLTEALYANLADKKTKRKAPLKLRQSADAILALFDRQARQCVRTALDAIDPDMNAMSVEARGAFERGVRNAAFTLFERNYEFNSLELDQARRILEVSAMLHARLYPKPKLPKGATLKRDPVTATPSTSQPSAESIVVSAFTRLKMAKDPGFHRLKRGTELMHAMLEPIFGQTLQQLQAAGFKYVTHDNLACALLLLPFVVVGTTPVGTALRNAKKDFSLLRFQQLVTCSGPEELFTQLQRALRFVDGKVSPFDLVRIALSWTDGNVDHTRKRLIAQYYALDEPATVLAA